MKNVLAAFLFCLVFGLAAKGHAAPFLVADVPDANADICVYTPASGAVVTGPVVVDAVLGLLANGNRICNFDIASSAIGTNNVKLRLRAGSGLWVTDLERFELHNPQRLEGGRHSPP